MNANYAAVGLALLVGTVVLGSLMSLPSSPVLASPARAASSVEPYSLPDLLPSSVQPVVALGTLTPDKLWVEVKNQGQAPVSNYGMKFEWGQGLASQQHLFLFQESLGPGQSRWVQVDARGYSLHLRSSRYRITLDYTYSVAESNEGNNVYTRL